MIATEVKEIFILKLLEEFFMRTSQFFCDRATAAEIYQDEPNKAEAKEFFLISLSS